MTDASIGRRLRESLNSAAELATKATRHGIHVVEPFAGMSLHDQGEFYVLGPTRAYYESLIPEFDGMPTVKVSLNTLLTGAGRSIARVLRRFRSIWGVDALDDEDTTSAKNNSSAITLLAVDGHQLLFTADAGISALGQAADRLDEMMGFGGFGANLRFIQIPHHGSRRNVGPAILNRLVGDPVAEGQKRNVSAVASTAKNGEPKHPRKAVMNAFTHRGAKAMATRGNTICHFHEAPARGGWTPVVPEEYHWEYEDEE